MTNWLKRPLRPEQIQYALSDVEHLFTLKDLLIAAVAEKGLQTKVAEQMQVWVRVKVLTNQAGPSSLPGSTCQKMRRFFFLSTSSSLAMVLQENIMSRQ